MSRLIGMIVIIAVMLFFIVLNTGDANKCDIQYWVTETAVFKQVPVFLTAFIFFTLGMLCSFPVMFFLRRNKKIKADRDKQRMALQEESFDTPKKKR
ncbi:MAG: hypothetical protein LBD79_10450 [Treponema sp.]|jgi:uncharacterized membrane protein YciS (DUF1049 family)|nr:hypothetical protein [Treponema sp.]